MEKRRNLFHGRRQKSVENSVKFEKDGRARSSFDVRGTHDTHKQRPEIDPACTTWSSLLSTHTDIHRKKKKKTYLNMFFLLQPAFHF
jgi:hypothetical protein